MKTLTKFFLAFSLILTVNVSYGQQKHRITMWPSSIAQTQQGCAMVTYQSPTGGYYAGNIGGLPLQQPGGGTVTGWVLEAGQLYDWTQMWLIDSITNLGLINPMIDTVRVRITRKTTATIPGDLHVKLYTIASSGTSFDLVATSNPVNISSINIANGVFTPFVFATPQPADVTFMVAVEFSQQTGDTVCVGMASCTEFNGFSFINIGYPGGSQYANIDKTLQTSPGVFLEGDLGIVPDLVFDFPTGISHDAGVKVFSAFPNPTENNIQFSFQLKQSDDVAISIFNMKGQVAKSVEYSNLSNGQYHKSINVSDLSSGLYMYEVSSSTGKTYGKFVKE